MVAALRWLLWDEHNIDHIGRHSVTPAEVEQAVYVDRRALVYEDDKEHR